MDVNMLLSSRFVCTHAGAQKQSHCNRSPYYFSQTGGAHLLVSLDWRKTLFILRYDPAATGATLLNADYGNPLRA